GLSLVIPAKVGTQRASVRSARQTALGSRVRGDDGGSRISHAESLRRRGVAPDGEAAFLSHGQVGGTIDTESRLRGEHSLSAPPRLCVRNFFPNFRPAIGLLLKPFPSRLSHRAWRC